MNQILSLWHRMVLSCLLATAAAGAAAAPLADPTVAGTTSLVLEYHVKPVNRLALRQFMQGEGLARLDKWKR